jgi:Ca-activated chloride channel family protein
MGVRTAGVAALVVVAASAWAWQEAGSWSELWATREQQAAKLLEGGAYDEAAERTADPLRRGEALFRAARFEEAAEAYTLVDTAEGAFNRGVALIMRGKYEEAAAACDRALELRPGWLAAEENRELARIRGERKKAEEGPGTGGQLEADEVVIGKKGKTFTKDADEVQVGDGEALSGEALQALWLRRVETRTADFLRAKFQHQHQTRSAGK